MLYRINPKTSYCHVTVLMRRLPNHPAFVAGRCATKQPVGGTIGLGTQRNYITTVDWLSNHLSHCSDPEHHFTAAGGPFRGVHSNTRAGVTSAVRCITEQPVL